MKTSFCRMMCLAFLTLAVSAASALAAPPDSSAEIENLKQRIEALETGMAGKPPEEQPFTLFAAGKHLSFSGLLKVEANYSEIDGEDASSDLNLTTFEFSTEVAINDHIGGHVILLYEEDPADDSLKVDEVVISLRCPQSLFGQSPTFHGGKMYLPFGKFNSSMLTDPLTLDLGETNDTAALFALEGDLWTFSLGVFNGGTDANKDKDHIDSLVAAIEVTPRENLSFGFSYISDLAESDNVLVADATLYSDSVPGASAFLSATVGAFGFEAEILAALDDFDTALIGASDLTGKKPLAWSLEASWHASEDLQLTARYEQSSDFQDDVTRYGAATSYGLFSNTVLALEYLHAAPDTDPDSDTVTVQLAFEY